MKHNLTADKVMEASENAEIKARMEIYLNIIKEVVIIHENERNGEKVTREYIATENNYVTSPSEGIKY